MKKTKGVPKDTKNKTVAAAGTGGDAAADSTDAAAEGVAARAAEAAENARRELLTRVAVEYGLDVGAVHKRFLDPAVGLSADGSKVQNIDPINVGGRPSCSIFRWLRHPLNQRKPTWARPAPYRPGRKPHSYSGALPRGLPGDSLNPP